MPSIQEIIFLIPILLISLSLHEYSHGKVSNILGDPTPKLMGRLTLNPLAHLDLIGSLVLIITRRIGWAKPVPINPRYYSNPRRGMMFVGLAGPGANFILALIFAVIVRVLLLLNGLEIHNMMLYGYASNLIIAAINFFILAILINLSLAVFNLIPIPPLDGSKILMGFTPPRFDRFFRTMEGPAGMVVLLILAYAGILSRIIGPVVNIIFRVLV